MRGPACPAHSHIRMLGVANSLVHQQPQQAGGLVLGQTL
jgi:hypothetical protein